jgi:SAM-dependent methyltransferase
VPGSIEQLPHLDIPGHAASTPEGANHPMRVITRRAAGLEGPPWDAEARADVGRLFDSLAGEWHTRSSPERTMVVTDALHRGGVGTGATAIEVGSGIGSYSGLLAERFRRVVALDLSIEMLRLAADAPGLRVQADACVLPLPDATVDAVVLINMLLFPDEVDRVLAPGGCVVWVNSSGESTPIHLPPEQVVAALPGEWTGVVGRAGVGLWAVLRRARR